MVLGDTGPHAANTWVSTWTGEQLVETTQALGEPRHHTTKTVCVRRSRGETDALAKQRRRGANTAQGEARNVNRWMILMKRS